MKYVRRLILLALIAGYFLWPYQQVKKFGQAVAARDSSTVVSMIDETAFKESMKELVVEAQLRVREQSVPAGVRFDKAEERGRIHSQMKSSAFTSAFDHLLKPETIARMLFAGQDPSAAEEFARGDPYVLNGLVAHWRVREWVTVVGAGAARPL